LKQKVNVAKTRTHKCQAQKEYNENREVKNNVRKDKRKWVEELATKEEIAAKTGNLMEISGTIKAVAKNRKDWQHSQSVRDTEWRM
jgi:hypothetical protein